MSNFYELNKTSENGGYDINYGYDIDNARFDSNYQLLSNDDTNAKYGDYDVLSNPAIGSSKSNNFGFIDSAKLISSFLLSP